MKLRQKVGLAMLGVGIVMILCLEGLASQSAETSPLPTPTTTTTKVTTEVTTTHLRTVTPTVWVTARPSTLPTAPVASPVPYYANCTEVRRAGEAPLHRGEPGYRSGLDRDRDGVACE